MLAVIVTESTAKISLLLNTKLNPSIRSLIGEFFDFKTFLSKSLKGKSVKADKKKQALMDDLRKQIKALNPDAKTAADDSTDVTDELDQDKDIIALKKQLEDIKNKKAAEALMDDLRKQILDLDPDAKPVTDGTDCLLYTSDAADE